MAHGHDSVGFGVESGRRRCGGQTRNEPLREKIQIRSFRRALGYLRPQRRRLFVSVCCAMGLALAYSGSVGAILPVLQVLIANEGPRTSAMMYLSGKRLGATLDRFDAEREKFAVPPPTGAAVVRTVEEGSVLSEAGVSVGDALFGRESGDAVSEWLERAMTLAADEPLALRALSRQDLVDRSADVRLPEVSFLGRVASRAVSWLPADATPNGRIRLLIVALGGILGINILGNVCRFWAEYLVHISSVRAIMDLRRHMFARTMNIPLAEFSENISDKMSRVVQDTQEVYRGFVALFGKIVREPLKAIAVFGVALWLDYRLTLIVLVGAAIGGWILVEFGRRVRKATTKILAGYGRVLGALNATLGGMRVVRGYAREVYERRRMWRIEREMFRQQKKIGRIDALTSPILETLGLTLAMCGIVWLANKTVHGNLSPERFVQMAIVLAAMFDPIRRISAVFTRIQRADAAAVRIFEIIDLPTEQSGGVDRPALRPFGERIEFRDVTYTYPSKSVPAICKLNLTIEKGQTVALVGPNGSGKTTMIGLLFRFFDPQSGSILIDGVDVGEVRVRSLRDQFSLVTQEAVVFAMTAGENIGYGRARATADEIRDAARRARADEFIERLPDGYDTMIGEYGATLSGGERQRISLARAILRNAPIFIFDEATSQVDVESERKIREAMTEFMKDRTSIVISHRIATVAGADRIVVFDMGQMVDSGRHEELMERCDLYRTLFHAHLQVGTETARHKEPAGREA